MASLPKIVLWNIRSFNAHRNELLLIIAREQADILLLTETRLALADSVSVPDFEVIRHDTDGRGGGVAILIHRALAFRTIAHSPSVLVEHCFIKLITPSVYIGVVYAPPQKPN